MNELYHYGIKRKSGRYPYGSGERPYQGVKEFVNILFSIPKHLRDTIINDTLKKKISDFKNLKD